MIGTSDQLICVDVAGSELVRRRALDAYKPGLGTAPLEDVLANARRTSDSAFLRSIFDATSWSKECYAVSR